jgi:predicted amidophosphoribosyltransferase
MSGNLCIECGLQFATDDTGLCQDCLEDLEAEGDWDEPDPPFEIAMQ